VDDRVKRSDPGTIDAAGKVLRHGIPFFPDDVYHVLQTPELHFVRPAFYDHCVPPFGLVMHSLPQLFRVIELPDLYDLALSESLQVHHLKLKVPTLVWACPGKASRHPLALGNLHVNGVLDATHILPCPEPMVTVPVPGRAVCVATHKVRREQDIDFVQVELVVQACDAFVLVRRH
jgi:hypothetical protein